MSHATSVTAFTITANQSNTGQAWVVVATNPDKALEIAIFIEAHQGLGFALLCQSQSLEQAQNLMEDHFGAYRNDEEWARSYILTHCEFPEFMEDLIDWNEVARQIKDRGEVRTLYYEGKVHVFRT